MNTPSPAPRRRRRTEERMEIDQSPDIQRAPSVQSRPRKKKKAPYRYTMPMWFRIVLIIISLSVFFTAATLITKSYLEAQEARRLMEQEASERAQHPLYYADYILMYAERNGLDPALVAAVILCESSFDPQAVSSVGARGLMQLMEPTAGWVAHKLDEDDADYSFDLLFDPETNIRFGTWYLGYLSRRFGGDPVKIICAYHAGQGNVDSWLSNPEYSADGVTLDVIPMDNTAAYANRVLRACGMYQKHYFPTPSPVPEMNGI